MPYQGFPGIIVAKLDKVEPALKLRGVVVRHLEVPGWMFGRSAQYGNTRHPVTPVSLAFLYLDKREIDAQGDTNPVVATFFSPNCPQLASASAFP